MKIHVLGVCGVFMGGLAAIAKQMGHEVTGSDKNCYPPMSTQLEDQGIKLYDGFNSADIEEIKPDLIIVGNAATLKRGSELIEYILNNKLNYTSGPQWLAENVLRHKKVIGISGTHGKTTTTSLTAFVLQECGLNPSFLVGGVCPDLGVSAKLTDSDFFVIEADEYNTTFFDYRSKFINYRPDYAIINNLEFDHADLFDDIEAIRRTFRHLVQVVPSNGIIIHPEFDKNIDQVLEKGCWTKTESFGENGDWTYKLLGHGFSNFEVFYKGELQGVVNSSLLGKHNLYNCLACIAVVNKAGVKPADAITAINKFGGVKRRMEVKGVVNNITVYDDFAHHPDAITTTVNGLRDSLEKGNIIAVWEPKSASMINGDHKEKMPQALASADKVIAYHNKDLVKWNIAEYIAKTGVENYTFEEVQSLVDKAIELANPDDHILIMTNGPLEGAHQRIVDGLTAKYQH